MLQMRLGTSFLLVAVFCCKQTQAVYNESCEQLDCVNVESCEGQNAQLDCGDNVIKLIAANYGRRNNHTCSAGRPVTQLAKTDCILPSSLSQAAYRCEGLSTCSVPVTNAEFTEPCFGTYKYLEMSYVCIEARKMLVPFKKHIGCEGCVTHLECGSGVIQIRKAVYGRRDPNICSLGRPGSQLENVACSIAKQGPLEKLCNGRKNCEFSVSNNLFGDPCYGTYKYLEVLFSCVG